MPPQNKIVTTVSDGLHDSRFTMYVEDAATIVEILTLVAEVLELIQPLIHGRIKRSSLNIDIPVPIAAQQEADDNADVEELGKFRFTSTDSSQYDLNLPTWDESYNVTGTNFIDTSDPDVAALVTYFENVNGDGIRLRSYQDDSVLADLTLQSAAEDWRVR